MVGFLPGDVPLLEHLACILREVEVREQAATAADAMLGQLGADTFLALIVADDPQVWELGPAEHAVRQPPPEP